MQRIYNLYSKELRWRQPQYVWNTACGSSCNGLPPHVVIYMDKERLPSLWEQTSGSNFRAFSNIRKSSPHWFLHSIFFYHCCLFFKCHVRHEYVIGFKCTKDSVGGSRVWRKLKISQESILHQMCALARVPSAQIEIMNWFYTVPEPSSNFVPLIHHYTLARNNLISICL